MRNFRVFLHDLNHSYFELFPGASPAEIRLIKLGEFDLLFTLLLEREKESELKLQTKNHNIQIVYLMIVDIRKSSYAHSNLFIEPADWVEGCLLIADEA